MPPPHDGETVLADIPRGDDGMLRLSIAEFKGHRYVATRVWTLARDGSAWFPTKSGGSIRLREIDDVVAALHEARRRTAEGGAA
jgi:hypothetical protein